MAAEDSEHRWRNTLRERRQRGICVKCQEKPPINPRTGKPYYLCVKCSKDKYQKEKQQRAQKGAKPRKRK